MTYYYSEVVSHLRPEVIWFNTNSSSSLNHRNDDIYKGLGYGICIQRALFMQLFAAQPLISALKCWKHSQDCGQVSHKRRQIGDNDVSLSFILSHLCKHITQRTNKHCLWLHSKNHKGIQTTSSKVFIASRILVMNKEHFSELNMLQASFQQR